jgi:hypothetical protein
LSVEKKSIVRHSNKEYIGHPLIILACCYPTNPPKSTLPKIFDKGFEKKNQHYGITTVNMQVRID